MLIVHTYLYAATVRGFFDSGCCTMSPVRCMGGLMF